MKILFIIACFCIHHTIQAQKHDNIWLIGRGIEPPQSPREASYKVEFINGILQQDTLTRNMEIYGTAASICDTTGNLQFYTNGIFINDYTHQLMENGDSLGDTDLMNAYQNINRVTRRLKTECF